MAVAQAPRIGRQGIDAGIPAPHRYMRAFKLEKWLMSTGALGNRIIELSFLATAGLELGDGASKVGSVIDAASALVLRDLRIRAERSRSVHFAIWCCM